MNAAANALLKRLDDLIAKPAGPGYETKDELKALSRCYQEDRTMIAHSLPAILAAIKADPKTLEYYDGPRVPSGEVQVARDLGTALLGRSHECKASNGYAHFVSFDSLIHALPKIRAQIRAQRPDRT